MVETRIVAPADEGIRLDRWFKRHQPGVTHGMLEKALRKGQVRLDGRKSEAGARIQAGQSLSFPEEWKEQAVFARAKKIWTPSEEDVRAIQSMVLYKDAHAIVINKPSGLAVQGGSGQSRNIDAMLDGLRFGHAERPRLVHRLDKDTSGCLVLARSAQAAAVLAKKFAEKETQKIYLALVQGLPLPMHDTIRLKLAKKVQGKDSRTEVYEAMEVDEKGGQHAVTEYHVLEHLSNRLSWVQLSPITGRTHQLRVHMAAIGHPIVGDGKYGGSEAFVQGSMGLSTQLCLHASRILVPDFYGKTLDVTAPLPPHMRKNRELLGME